MQLKSRFIHNLHFDVLIVEFLLQLLKPLSLCLMFRWFLVCKKVTPSYSIPVFILVTSALAQSPLSHQVTNIDIAVNSMVYVAYCPPP